MQRVKLFVKSFLCLLNANLYLEELVNIDFQKGLDSNVGLKAASEQHKNESREELRKTILEQRMLLCKKLRDSSLWILLAIVLGGIMIFGQGMSIGPKTDIGVLSLFCFSWATLGRLGWEEQTCMVTVFGKLDSDLFWLLYFLGTILGVASIAIG